MTKFILNECPNFPVLAVEESTEKEGGDSQPPEWHRRKQGEQWQNGILACQLGKRFTGGAVVTKHFADLADARNWIFGGAQKEKAEPGSVLTLEQRFGAAAFALSPAQINEAAWAVQNLPAGTSLTDAVKFFNRHHRQADQARRISEAVAEIVRAKTLSGRQGVTLPAWRETGGGLQ